MIPSQAYVLIAHMFIRYLRFIIRSADNLLSKPASLASLQNQATTSETRQAATEQDLSETKKLTLINCAKIEEEADGRLNES